MSLRSASIVLALAVAICAPGAAVAGGDVAIVVPVGRAPVWYGVPRAKPTSATKQYPFGLLTEDYTPYGMPGVPDRLYFTRNWRVTVR